MVVLDATIVNVALPSIQHGLHFSPRRACSGSSTPTRSSSAASCCSAAAPPTCSGGSASSSPASIVFTVASLVNGLATSSGHADRAAARCRASAPRSSRRPRSRSSRRRSPRAASARRRSASGARSPPAAARSACSSAACSPRRSRGAGSSSSTCRSGSPRSLLALRFVPNSRAEERPETVDVAGAVDGHGRAARARLRHRQGAGLRLDVRQARSGSSALAVALLAAFVVIELRSKAPLIRLGIFRMRSLSGGNVAMLLRHRRPLRDVLLRVDLRAGGARLQPAEGRVSRSCRSRSGS